MPICASKQVLLTVTIPPVNTGLIKTSFTNANVMHVMGVKIHRALSVEKYIP